jgi:hypothetical protein
MDLAPANFRTELEMLNPAGRALAIAAHSYDRTAT